MWPPERLEYRFDLSWPTWWCKGNSFYLKFSLATLFYFQFTHPSSRTIGSHKFGPKLLLNFNFLLQFVSFLLLS